MVIWLEICRARFPNGLMYDACLHARMNPFASPTMQFWRGRGGGNRSYCFNQGTDMACEKPYRIVYQGCKKKVLLFKLIRNRLVQDVLSFNKLFKFGFNSFQVF